MTDEYYREYYKIQNIKKLKLQGIEKKIGAFLIGVRQASNAMTTCPKCKWVLKKVKEGQKTLIYSAFLDKGVKKIQELLDKNNIWYAEVTGSLSKKQRLEEVRKYNSNEVDVLFITKAGGEGLDLKGTRNVIIVESAWNRPNEEQVIGRAIRYESHTHLPKNEQHVDIYRLIMVKPNKLDYEDKIPKSADQLLQDLMDQKEKLNTDFLKLIKPISIETNNLSDSKRKENFTEIWNKYHESVSDQYEKYLDKVGRFAKI
jgi:SNF2 family DNA or RNA helicase